MLGHAKKWLEKDEFEYVELNGIKYPTAKTIINLHDFLVQCFVKEGEEVHGGTMSDANLSFHGIKYYEIDKKGERDNIIFKAAHIFNQFLEAGHPFVDGNKRTGFVTLWLFLTMNGLELKLSMFAYKKHLEKINKWADLTDSDNIGEIIDWLKQNIK